MNTKGSMDYCDKFFRVYMPNSTEEDMNLPFGSNKISGTPLPRKVTVKCVTSGNSWRMEMTRNSESNTVFLRDGWKKIVKDENLNEPTFLEFEFDGSCVFHFCVFEYGSMCKRVRSPMAKEVIEGDSEDADDEYDDFDEDYVIPSDEEENTKGFEEESSRRKEKVGMSKWLNHEFEEYLDNKLNPSFLVDMNQTRTRIPAVLIKDYNLTFPNSVFLQDKIGKLMKKISVWGNGSVFISGFSSIFRRNRLKPDEKFLCELKLVDGSNGFVQEIKIHIVRG